ncbi:hypothetical protein PV08_03381 [Exophiala spinifera]|uniref:Uncharacterized protein n=1 Tax=Exophiala spinifera TaxID=91928 RepID=A0A0D2C6B2_9EURO|nr:uncharacterized protein PV08_03381 [Exophiala spinifera]KIW19089.1 hypothetical protein PV08_03381 [Exophiala spinifera]
MSSSGNADAPARSSHPLRRDKEKYLFQSRIQKIPYKEIARRLDKTVLACRLHHHHLKAGRKGRRPDEIGDDDSELSDTTASSNSPSPPSNTGGPAMSPQEQSRKFSSGPQTLPVRTTATQTQRLPNFETFMRDTFPEDSFHRRTVSAPQNNMNISTATWSGDSRSTAFPGNDSRHVRKQSGKPQNNTPQSYQGATKRLPHNRDH